MLVSADVLYLKTYKQIVYSWIYVSWKRNYDVFHYLAVPWRPSWISHPRYRQIFLEHGILFIYIPIYDTKKIDAFFIRVTIFLLSVIFEKNGFLTFYTSFCKRHNSLKNWLINVKFVMYMYFDLLNNFCSLGHPKKLIVSMVVSLDLISWRPSWIFGGHFEIFRWVTCIFFKEWYNGGTCQVWCL